MDFKNAKELLDFCQKLNCPISDIMKQRECTLAETSLEDIYAKMDHALSIMRESASSPIQEPKKSIGGLIGGEARLADLHRARGAAICGSVLSRAITYSMAVLETNTSMGLIVAAPPARPPRRCRQYTLLPPWGQNLFSIPHTLPVLLFLFC